MSLSARDLDGIEAALLDELAARKDELVQMVVDMVRIPCENPPGRYEAVAAYVADFMSKNGLHVEKIDVPKQVLAKAEVEGPRINVIAKSGSAQAPCLWFSSHLDTVPVDTFSGGEWSVDPLAGIVRDGRIWGRGACDSKARMACYMMVAALLANAKLDLDASFALAASVDEETGICAFTGSGYLADHGYLDGARFAIIEGNIDEVSHANMGEISLRFSVQGDAVHNTQLQRPAVNANHLLAHALAGVLSYEDELRSHQSAIRGIGHSALNISCINGGGAENMTAATAQADVEIVYIPEDDAADIIDEIRRRATNAVGEKHADRLEIRERLITPPSVCRPNSDLVQALLEASEKITGTRPDVCGLPGRSDFVHFARVGAQAVNFGPGRMWETNLHLADENVRVDDLLNATRIVLVASLRLLARSSTPRQ